MNNAIQVDNTMARFCSTRGNRHPTYHPVVFYTQERNNLRAIYKFFDCELVQIFEVPR